MARRRRKNKVEITTTKIYDGSDFDDRYQYFHLGYLETAGVGAQVEQGLIDNGIKAEKSLTMSGCFTFRWKRDAYDKDMLESIFMVSDYPGMKYIQKPWSYIDEEEKKTSRRRHGRSKT